MDESCQIDRSSSITDMTPTTDMTSVTVHHHHTHDTYDSLWQTYHLWLTWHLWQTWHLRQSITHMTPMTAPAEDSTAPTQLWQGKQTKSCLIKNRVILHRVIPHRVIPYITHITHTHITHRVIPHMSHIYPTYHGLFQKKGKRSCDFSILQVTNNFTQLIQRFFDSNELCVLCLCIGSCICESYVCDMSHESCECDMNHLVCESWVMWVWLMSHKSVTWVWVMSHISVTWIV